MGRYPGTPKHVHKYEFRKGKTIGRGAFYYDVAGIWMCADSYCTHYLPRNIERTINGRGSRCHRCDKEFSLNTEIIEETLDNLTELGSDTLVGQPLCDSCASRHIAAETRTEYEQFIKGKPVEKDEDLKQWIDERFHADNRLRNLKYGPEQTESKPESEIIESVNVWCDSCQVHHPEGQHI